MKKVVKFGGSSLASAEQFRKVSEIIHADKDRRYVVPSAPGKRGSKDTKVTDMLYDCYSAAGDAESLTKKMAAIQARYLYDLFVPGKSVVSIGAIVEPAAAAGSN